MISILIIGNEILSGQVEDSNLKHMLGRLNRSGYTVDEVRVIRDETPIISQAIRELSQRSRFVVSTGGIGPTHDDVTLEAYAQAFGVPLISHPRLVQKIRDFFGDTVKESSLRMALVPENIELIETGPKRWPLLKVGNCFVLPGLPEVFLKKFDAVMAVLPEAPDAYFCEIFTRSMETDFAVFLSEAQDRFPNVELGSYPTFDQIDFAARITLKSGDPKSMDTVFEELRAFFSEKQTLVRYSARRRVQDV